MKTKRRAIAVTWFAMGLLVALRAQASEVRALWSIGKSDGGNAEFALAPGRHEAFREDAFFFVGHSRSEQDWPYVQPGPMDVWASERSHTFRVVFGVRTGAPVAAEDCRLALEFIDTHEVHPPVLRVEVNGRGFEKGVAKGGGDASIRGEPRKGTPSRLEITFPASLLKNGENEIAITTVSGSWLLYDAVTLLAPASVEAAAVEERTFVSEVRLPPVLKRYGGESVQPLVLGVRHVGDDADAAVLLDGRKVSAFRLRGGAQKVEVAAPAVDGPKRTVLRLVVRGQILAERELTLRPPPLREVYLLPHSHVDIGYTHRQSEVVGIQIDNLEKAIQLAAGSAGNPEGMRFKWNPEAIWTIDHFLKQATSEKREAFLRAVRRRDVGLDGLYANMLTGLCRPEELARVVAYAPRLSAMTGVTVDSAAICDVPGYTWGLTSVMGQAGIKYFAVGPNLTDRIGSVHAAWDQRPFYWRSPSGRERVLTWIVDHYWFGGDLEPHVLGYLDAQEKRAFPYDMGYIYWTGRWKEGGVDNAPPDEETARKVVEWNEKYASPTIRIATASEFFNAFERRHGERLPTFAGDMTPYWEDGAASTARETGMNRVAADRLVQAETLYALLAPDKRPAAGFEEAWRNVILYSEHTWGAWNSISAPDDPFVTDQWKVKRGFALDADAQSRQLLAGAVAGRVGATGPSMVDVFNTTQWPRTDVVTVGKALSAAGDRVTGADGTAVASQRLASGELAFVAAAVPAFGAKRYRVSSGPARAMGAAKADGGTISNGRLTATVDAKSGAVASLRLRGIDADVVDRGAAVGINDYRYLLGTDPRKAEPNGLATIRVVDAGPLVATVRVESAAPGCDSLVREVRVIDGQDRVELTNHVDRRSVRQKDAVHFGFGFNVPGGVVRMETPWAVVRPNVDQLPGSCRNWFTVQRWVDVSNDEYGVTWAPIEAPLVQLGGITANVLGQVRLEEWMEQAHESQTIYSWAMNNHWHTNYKADQPGLTTFRYVVRPHRAGYSGTEAARFGMETTRPLVAVAAAGETLVEAPFTLSSDDVLVETLKVSEDGKATIVRLFGVSGTDRRVTLRPARGEAGRVYLSDLSELPRAASSSGAIDVPAYGVVTVRIEN